MNPRSWITRFAAAALSLACSSLTFAQQQFEAKVPIAWNRYYDYDQITAMLQQLAAAHPHLLALQSIGQSEQGREMWLVTLNNAATGADIDKPAMWIDGNIHGNEIQAAETVLYSIWYMAENHGRIDSLTQLIDRAAFYFVPMSNPDGRAEWFATPTNPHNYRTGLRPTDNDLDGRLDEDGPDDIDGDGHIGAMWKADPNGTHRRDEKDPRIFIRIDLSDPREPHDPPGGRWSFAGGEGIDNDGDGQINEDGPGGYDMNRNWPSDWQPNHVQFGAGDFPFSFPETRAIGQFILNHPNIAAGQSYHNAGGMILRGPGAGYLEGNFPGRDRETYDRLAQAGVEMLPFYRYLIIHSGLYTVHGGFVNWLSEGLGIVSFTNELWTEQRILQNGSGPDEAGEFRWRDRMLFGQTWTDYTEHQHPVHGRVLVGGGTKYSGRIPPPFMLEEECHRNFAFTMFHADHMPLLSFEDVEAKSLGGDLWQITLDVVNSKIIPSRTQHAANKRVGQPDRLTLEGQGVTVLTSGTLNDRFDTTLDPVEHRPHIIPVTDGIPGVGRRTLRFFVQGPAGADVTLRYASEKARWIEQTIDLRPMPPH